MLSLEGGWGQPPPQLNIGHHQKRKFFWKWAENDSDKISSTANVSVDHSLFRHGLLVCEIFDVLSGIADNLLVLKVALIWMWKHLLHVVISQTHWLVSRVRLAQWCESLYLLNEQCCHLSRGGSNSQLVCHTTLFPLQGGGWPQPINYILNIFVLNYYIH